MQKLLIKQEELATVSAVAGSFGYIAPEYAQTARVNEKTDVYSFGVVLLELTTGKAANYGHKGLTKWALRHGQEGKTIVDALDEEIKEPCYVDEMSNVFQLGVFCTSKEPSARPHMKEVVHILLGGNHPLVYGVKSTGSEYDSTPLLKNSKRKRQSESDGTLAFDN